ncbi:SWIM zinc finger family protein [Actinocrinis puniceicyclus]|uniref:SWIM zinc finger family protein n=1 Tax=Actinocrinis puniceicyclus TaxID=977794 RepID=A0A8J7WRQ2_9ACTN|nr:SWIM zinc finger family protein [Actinocrinis puniceicyclus]MBS2964335.1 SWIM zinc finger family protein [Actinocrinis puniceicyclus]
MTREPEHQAPAARSRRVAGLAVRSQRGAIGSSWWSQRFIAVVEGFGHGARLTRGRAYARAGNVLDLSVRAGEVAASVQGTRPKPYSVTLRIDVYSAEQWARVERGLLESAGYIAQLLDGRMPERIDRVFASAGLTLFPVRREFRTDCTCPDWERPCKHVAATCYVLAEQLDDDPFRLLAWRGRDRAALLRRLEALRDEQAWQDTEEEPQDPPLADVAGAYWSSPVAVPGALASRPDTPAAAVLDRLGPLGRGLRGQDLTDLLRPAYRAMRGPR